MPDLSGAATVQVSPVGTGAPVGGGYWNAKSGPPAWIEFTWPNSLVTIDQVALTVDQSPSPCLTTHLVICTLDNGAETSVGLSGTTYDDQVLTINLGLANVWRLQIWTTQSQSWVGWKSIGIIGNMQAIPSPPDVGSACTVTTQPVGVGSPANGGYWNAKAGPVASVNFAFPGPAVLGFAQLSLIVVQSPAGFTDHQVVATMSDGTENIVATFSGTTSDGELLRSNIGNISGATSMRIDTLASPSWVAWRGIQINAPLAAPSSARKKNPTRWIDVATLDT